MEVKELRIGNIIYIGKIDDDFGYHQGTHIIDERLMADILRNETIRKNMKGVKLSEDNFWQFGFIKKEKIDDDFRWVFDNPIFGAFYKKNDYWLPEPYYFSDAFSSDFKLEYIHQLQNLYFALMQEDIISVAKPL